MKEKIPTGAFVAIVVVVVALIGFIGFKFLAPRHENTSAADMQKRITEHGGGYSSSGAPSKGMMGGGYAGSGGRMMGGRPSSGGGYPMSGGR